VRAPEQRSRHRTVARAVFALAAAGVFASLVGAAVARSSHEAASSVPDRILFPIVGPASWTDDFGAPRAQGGHEGNDILSDWRAPVVAVEAGKVRTYTKSARAGCMLYLYGKSGTTYLYIHLNEDLTPKNDGRGGCKPGVAYAEGLRDGDRVQAGQLLGYVGSSGDAGATNHLHFELHPNDGAAVSPYKWLKRADRLLFVPPAEGTALLATDQARTLTLTGTVVKVEVGADAGDAEPVAASTPPATESEPPAAEAGTSAAPAAPTQGEWPPTGQIPVLVGRAGATTTLLTLRVTDVKLSSGGEWKVERNVTVAVPAGAVVERVKGAKTRRAKLESAEEGERVTVTTDHVGMTLEWRLARPGKLTAAHVLFRGES
jgi:hypothetical protein